MIVPRDNDTDAVGSIVSSWSGPPNRIIPGDRDTVTRLSQCGERMYVSVLMITQLMATEDAGEFMCSVDVAGIKNTPENTTVNNTFAINFGNG